MMETTRYDRKSTNSVQVCAHVRHLLTHIVIKLLLPSTKLRHVPTEESDGQKVSIIPCCKIMNDELCMTK